VRTNCDQARKRLSLQLDSELSPHETLMLERHLVRCPACAAFAAQARVSTEVLRSAPLEPAPQFWLTRRPASATRFTARIAAVTAAAAAAVLVALSTVSLQGGAAGTSATSGLWPTGAAVHPNVDHYLGVRHLAFERPTPDGPRRGLGNLTV
jgi:anti-sigma factor RsiW